jgi:hypothetical protein
MKQGSRFGNEMKDLTTLISDNRIIGRGTLFLQMGKPSTQGEYKVKLLVGSLSKLKTDTINHDIMEIADFTI